MTLPFQKDNSRKWTCFICGKQHSDFETFKQHIVDTHEEGREYIICPLERCAAPVRDMKLHFKAKHPTCSVPKSGQMKTIIWKDLGPSGKTKTRKPVFRDGYFISEKCGGKEMHYRSHFECEFYEVLEALPEVLNYFVEPIKDGIPYLFEGKQHRYYPDIGINFETGRTEIWECKPSSQTDLPVNKAKWEAATHYCEARNWEFIVFTEQGLNKLKARVRREKALNE